jgi:hypothetical protein
MERPVLRREVRNIGLTNLVNSPGRRRKRRIRKNYFLIR